MIRRARFFTAVVLGVVLLVPSNVFSCGPFFEQAVFSFRDHPDYPLKPYASGNLGIVRPTYSRIYLVTAYRYLAGRPLSASERDGALGAWYEQLRGPFYEGRLARNSSQRAMDRWVEIRDAALLAEVRSRDESGHITSFSQYAGGNNYDSYINCSNDAFRTAVNTFEDRSKRYTAAELKDWVQAQNTVFSNCSEGHAIPAPAPVTSSALFRADRAYQIAAAQFYSGKLDEARSAFQTIAGDVTSPWHEIARYVAVRALIRKGTLVTPPDKTFDPGPLVQAKSELRSILADNNAKAIHAPARQLLGFVSAKLHPEERVQELARTLSVPMPDPDFEQDLLDYVVLLDRLLDKSPFYYRPNEPQEVMDRRNDSLAREWKKAAEHARQVLPANSDLTDWLITFQAKTREAKAHAISKWHETQSLPWLVAALDRTTGKDADVGELMRAAAMVPIQSPAYDTLVFHHVRLLLEQGRTTAARNLLDQVLATRQAATPPSSLNAFLSQREQAAATFDDFLNYAPRYPANLGWQGLDEESPFCDGQADCRKLVYGERFDYRRQLQRWDESTQQLKDYPLRTRFDVDAARILNKRLPLNLLVQAAASPKLPEHLRDGIALAAWTRAVILGDASATNQLGQRLRDSVPKLAPHIAVYDKEPSAEGKKFAGAFAILHFPALRPYVDPSEGRAAQVDGIDNLRDNWWCPDVGARIGVTNFEKTWYDNSTQDNASYAPDQEFPIPGFLSPEQEKLAGAQWRKLSQIGTGPNYLAGVVLSYAKSHPGDPRVPEALHLSVYATRYGCVDKQTTRFSREAFTLLHQRYPKSSWAKKTKYWF